MYFVALCNNLNFFSKLNFLSVLAACKKHEQWSPALQLLSDIAENALQLDGRVARLDRLTEELTNTYSESHSVNSFFQLCRTSLPSAMSLRLLKNVVNGPRLRHENENE